MQEAIIEITAGDGADVIYDAVGAPGLEELVWVTKRFGHIIVYGYLGAMEDATPLPLGARFLRGLNLRTSYRIFDFTGHPKLGIPPNRRAIERAKKFIFDGLASELFKPKVDRVFVGLEDYVAAHELHGHNCPNKNYCCVERCEPAPERIASPIRVMHKRSFGQ